MTYVASAHHGFVPSHLRFVLLVAVLVALYTEARTQFPSTRNRHEVNVIKQRELQDISEARRGVNETTIATATVSTSQGSQIISTSVSVNNVTEITSSMTTTPPMNANTATSFMPIESFSVNSQDEVAGTFISDTETGSSKSGNKGGKTTTSTTTSTTAKKSSSNKGTGSGLPTANKDSTKSSTKSSTTTTTTTTTTTADKTSSSSKKNKAGGTSSTIIVPITEKGSVKSGDSNDEIVTASIVDNTDSTTTTTTTKTLPSVKGSKKSGNKKSSTGGGSDVGDDNDGAYEVTTMTTTGTTVAKPSVKSGSKVSSPKTIADKTVYSMKSKEVPSYKSGNRTAIPTIAASTTAEVTSSSVTVTGQTTTMDDKGSKKKKTQDKKSKGSKGSRDGAIHAQNMPLHTNTAFSEMTRDSEHTFYETISNMIDVGVGNRGDNILWYNSTWTDKYGIVVGNSSGSCLVLSPSPRQRFWCEETAMFVDSSTLTFQGVDDEKPETTKKSIIIGGTGRYGDVSGIVFTRNPPASLVGDVVFTHTVQLH